jgi:PAS domain S-box-containing protein
MKTIRAFLIDPLYRLIRLGIGLSIFFLIGDVVMDVFYFHEENILDQIIAPSPHEIYMRLSVVVVILVFSFYAQYIAWRLQISQSKMELELAEHKRAEEALLESEERYRMLVDKSPYGISIHQDGKIAFVNQAAVSQMRAKSADELIGKPISIFVHPETWDATRSRIQRMLQGEAGLYPIEDRYVRLDGSVIPVQVTASPFTLKGRPAIQIIALDITARKQVEEALGKAEANYRSIFENATVGIFQSTPEGHFQNVNRALVRIYGYDSPEEMLSTVTDITSQIYVDPASRREFQRELAKKGEITGFVSENYRKDGSRIWTVTGARAVKDTLGNILYYEGFVTDITERKRAEEALFSSETKFREMAEQMVDVLFVTDNNGMLTYGSPSTAHLFGFGPAEMIGHNFIEFLADTEIPRAMENFRKTIEAGLPSQQLELIMKRRDGSTFPGELYASIFIRDGRNAGTMGLIRDITEHKQAEERIQRQLRRLASLRVIDDAITGSFDMSLVLDIVLEQMTTQLNIDAACVLLLNPHSLTLTYTAGRGFRTNTFKLTNLRLGEGNAGRAALENRVIYIPDLRGGNTGFLRSPHFLAEKFVAYYAVPLNAKGQIVGVLEILQRSPISPDAEWLDFLETLAKQAAIAMDNAQLFSGLQRANANLVLSYDDTIEGWSRALDLRDKETEGHTRRVAEMTVRLARAMDMREEEIVHVRRGALLHDIGKMGVPDAILLKPFNLTEDEWKLMRQHPTFAYEMLHPITYLRPAMDIPHCHHEKWDGTGYPNGMKGEAIPLAARIFAVVDVWDALRSDRPYRAAWSEEKVLEHIRSLSGTHFDPKMVELFIREISKKTDKQLGVG